MVCNNTIKPESQEVLGVTSRKDQGNLVDGSPFIQQSQSQILLFFIEFLRPPELDPEAGR
jgi:hypothetical protein